MRKARRLRGMAESIRPCEPRPTRRDCHARLLAAMLAAAGEDSRIAASGFAPWCSATFEGACHRLTILFRDAAADRRAAAFAHAIGTHEFGIGGHVVADVAIDALVVDALTGEARVELSALTIEAW
jgi:hypothetical protein